MEPTDKARRTGVVDSWEAQGSHTNEFLVNPGAGVIMADTGQLVAGYYDLYFNMSGSAAHSYFAAQHRNAANALNLHLIYISLPALGAVWFKLSNWKVATNERLRLVNGVGAAGSFAGVVLWTRRA